MFPRVGHTTTPTPVEEVNSASQRDCVQPLWADGALLEPWESPNGFKEKDHPARLSMENHGDFST